MASQSHRAACRDTYVSSLENRRILTQSRRCRVQSRPGEGTAKYTTNLNTKAGIPTARKLTFRTPQQTAMRTPLFLNVPSSRRPLREGPLARLPAQSPVPANRIPSLRSDAPSGLSSEEKKAWSAVDSTGHTPTRTIIAHHKCDETTHPHGRTLKFSFSTTGRVYGKIYGKIYGNISRPFLGYFQRRNIRWVCPSPPCYGENRLRTLPEAGVISCVLFEPSLSDIYASTVVFQCLFHDPRGEKSALMNSTVITRRLRAENLGRKSLKCM